MISSINSYSSMASMGSVSGPPPGGKPNGPPPADAIEKGVDKLQQSVESGQINIEELSSQLTSQFGEDADGIISEDGEVDFDALTSLLTKAHGEEMQAKLTERFGEDANGVVSENGEIDHDALSALMQSKGQSGRPEGPPPQNGQSGDSSMDFLKSLLGEGGNASGYGDRGQAQNTSSRSAASYINLVA